MARSGYTNQRLGREINRDPSAVSRWRNGTTRPNGDVAEQLDGILGCHGALVRAWHRDTTGADRDHWKQRVPWYEANSHTIEMASPHLIQGTLQSRAYARFMLREALYWGTDAEMDKEVARRCSHQGWLAENGNPWVVGVFPLAALTCLPLRVRRDQAARLLSLIDTERVTVHLVNDQTPIGLPAMLNVYHLRDGSTAAASEHNGGMFVHEQAASVARLADMFKRVLASALPKVETRSVLQEIAT
ncbi:Scr1 family TA system antitoxin-like transcriptional regulator [Nocardiopsis sp. NPDC049922]|uniref:helix-turn-helix domain-containing protein n=1 Tax=Nocardiopsis sp. NPDC049922 TaxID=3155157 RepID=UPI0033C9B5D7